MKGAKSTKPDNNKLKTTKAPVKRGVKNGKAAKRPPSAFFVFMEDFRQSFKAENPNNKSLAAVAKAGGAEWKTLSDADKAPYVATAQKRKAEYISNMISYDQKLANEANEDDEESPALQSPQHSAVSPVLVMSPTAGSSSRVLFSRVNMRRSKRVSQLYGITRDVLVDEEADIGEVGDGEEDEDDE